MLTRCPACETTFRITPEQLKARQGKVRCGECQHVFNALESLVEEKIALVPVVPVVPAAAPSPADEPSSHAEAPAEAVIAVPPAPTFEPAPDEAPLSPLDALPAELPPEPEPESEPGPPLLPPLAPEIPPEPVPTIAPEAANQWTAVEPPPDPLLHEESGPEKIRRWPWLLGGLCALLALVLQVAIHFRVELAVLSPDARPMLEAICELAGCRVDLPSKAELMTIETSDLQPDAEQKGLLKLSATLHNRAPFTQAYPHLELSLTDAENKALARRVLRPEDYLPRGAAVAAGLATGEFSVNVSIDSGDVGASGYRLYLFYP